MTLTSMVKGQGHIGLSIFDFLGVHIKFPTLWPILWEIWPFLTQFGQFHYDLDLQGQGHTGLPIVDYLGVHIKFITLRPILCEIWPLLALFGQFLFDLDLQGQRSRSHWIAHSWLHGCTHQIHHSTTNTLWDMAIFSNVWPVSLWPWPPRSRSDTLDCP